MRRLVWCLVVLALVWCGWWVLASSSLQNAADRWLQERRSEGWQAEATALDVRGFPTRFALTLTSPLLADPETGVAFSTSEMVLASPAWWPGNVTLALPDDMFTIATPVARYPVTAATGQAALNLHPGPALELEHAGVNAGPWKINSPAGTLWGAQALTLQLQQSPVTPTEYSFDANAPAFMPGDAIRSALRIPQDWPIAFNSLTTTGTVTLDRPIDRGTIEKSRPQPRQINLELAEAEWGALLLRASADLSVSDQGLISGQMSLQARNWQDMLDVAETSGALPEALRPQFENILGALARGSGNPDALDLTLQARDGALFMGFVPLGQLPPLVLR